MNKLPIGGCTLYYLSSESNIVTRLIPIMTKEGPSTMVELYGGAIFFVVCGEKLLAHSAGKEFSLKSVSIFSGSEWQGGENITPDWDTPTRELGDNAIVLGTDGKALMFKTSSHNED